MTDKRSFRFVVSDGTVLRGKELILLRKLQTQSTEEMIHTVLIPLIMKRAPVSLRALDWSVVNYSKEKHIICSGPAPGQKTSIHAAYQDSLRFWKRRLFDPFRRRFPVTLVVGDESYQTTLGQANFAHFVHSTGVINYVVANIADIERNMNAAVARQRRERQKALAVGAHRIRQSLTQSDGAPMILYPRTETITFGS